MVRFISISILSSLMLGATSLLLARQQQSILLRLNECVEAALQNNHGLKASRAKTFAAEARASEAFTSLLPQVKLSSRLAQLSDIDPFSLTAPGFGSLTLFPNINHNYSARVSFQQPIFTGSRLVKNLEMAKLNVTATQEDVARDEADMILEVKSTYWNLVRAIEVEKVIRQTVTQVSEHLRDIRNFSRQGLATENDVYKVEVQLADVKVKLIEAESNRRLVAMALNNLIDKPLEAEIIPTEQFEGTVPKSDSMRAPFQIPSSMIRHANENRPELKSMRFRKEMNEAGVAAARAGWFPQVALSANYDYSRPNSRIIPPKDQWDGTWDVGITLQWNVWDWMTTSHQTSQAQAALQQTEEGLAQLENAINLQVAQAYYKEEEMLQKRAVARQGVVQATESYRITNEKFKKGIATNTELLDAETSLLQAKLTYTQANIDYQIAHAQVLRAVAMK